MYSFTLHNENYILELDSPRLENSDEASMEHFVLLTPIQHAKFFDYLHDKQKYLDCPTKYEVVKRRYSEWLVGINPQWLCVISNPEFEPVFDGLDDVRPRVPCNLYISEKYPTAPLFSKNVRAFGKEVGIRINFMKDSKEIDGIKRIDNSIEGVDSCSEFTFGPFCVVYVDPQHMIPLDMEDFTILKKHQDIDFEDDSCFKYLTFSFDCFQRQKAQCDESNLPGQVHQVTGSVLQRLQTAADECIIQYWRNPNTTREQDRVFDLIFPASTTDLNDRTQVLPSMAVKVVKACSNQFDWDLETYISFTQAVIGLGGQLLACHLLATVSNEHVSRRIHQIHAAKLYNVTSLTALVDYYKSLHDVLRRYPLWQCSRFPFADKPEPGSQPGWVDPTLHVPPSSMESCLYMNALCGRFDHPGYSMLSTLLDRHEGIPVAAVARDETTGEFTHDAFLARRARMHREHVLSALGGKKQYAELKHDDWAFLYQDMTSPGSSSEPVKVQVSGHRVRSERVSKGVWVAAAFDMALLDSILRYKGPMRKRLLKKTECGKLRGLLPVDNFYWFDELAAQLGIQSGLYKAYGNIDVGLTQIKASLQWLERSTEKLDHLPRVLTTCIDFTDWNIQTTLQQQAQKWAIEAEEMLASIGASADKRIADATVLDDMARLARNLSHIVYQRFSGLPADARYDALDDESRRYFDIWIKLITAVMSGQFRTTQDNSEEHSGAVKISDEDLSSFPWYQAWLRYRIVGDDGEGSNPDFASAFALTRYLAKCGFSLNNSKQLCGTMFSEYLRVLFMHDGPKGNANRSISTTVGSDLQGGRKVADFTRASSLSASVSVLVRRGFDAKAAEKLLLVLTDHWCQVWDGSKFRPLPKAYLFASQASGGAGAYLYGVKPYNLKPSLKVPPDPELPVWSSLDVDAKFSALENNLVVRSRVLAAKGIKIGKVKQAVRAKELEYKQQLMPGNLIGAARRRRDKLYWCALQEHQRKYGHDIISVPMLTEAEKAVVEYVSQLVLTDLYHGRIDALASVPGLGDALSTIESVAFGPWRSSGLAHYAIGTSKKLHGVALARAIAPSVVERVMQQRAEAWPKWVLRSVPLSADISISGAGMTVADMLPVERAVLSAILHRMNVRVDAEEALAKIDAADRELSNIFFDSSVWRMFNRV
jgi:hypothetical protein